jgi:hypothetical protein
MLKNEQFNKLFEKLKNRPQPKIGGGEERRIAHKQGVSSDSLLKLFQKLDVKRFKDIQPQKNKKAVLTKKQSNKKNNKFLLFLKQFRKLTISDIQQKRMAHDSVCVKTRQK